MFRSYIIFNPENLRPVDVTLPSEDGDALYFYAESLCIRLESAGRHVAELMFDDFIKDATVMRRRSDGEERLSRVNWIVRWRSVVMQRENYVPRHRKTNQDVQNDEALKVLRERLGN